MLNVGQRHRRLANINPVLVQSNIIVTLPPTCRYHTCMYVAYDRPGRHEVFARCWYSVGPQSAALDRRCTALGGRISCFVHWPGVDLVPGRRRRRWTSIESALGLFLLFAG